MDEDQLHYFAVVVILLVVFFWYLFGFGGSPAKKNAETSPTVPPVTVRPEPASNECSEVFKSCTAEGVVAVAGCKREAAEEQLKAELASPFDAGGCDEVRTTIARNCPEGCHLSAQAFIVVPGDLEVDQLESPDAPGACRFKGSRQVQVRAVCVSD